MKIIDDNDMKNIEQSVNTLKEHLGKNTEKLTSKQRKSLAKYGDTSEAFVMKASDYAIKNPHLVPPFVDAENLQQSLNQLAELKSFSRQLHLLLKTLDDTILLNSCDAYQNALVFYKSLKSAIQIDAEGADRIRADLAHRFKFRSRAHNDARELDASA